VAGPAPRWFTRPKTVNHRGTNRARRSATSTFKTNALPLSQESSVTKPEHIEGQGRLWCNRRGRYCYCRTQLEQQTTMINGYRLSWCGVSKLRTTHGWEQNRTYSGRCIWICVKEVLFLPQPQLVLFVPGSKNRMSAVNAKLIIVHIEYSVGTTLQWLVHWPLLDGLLHLVQQGGDLAGPQPADRPLLARPCPGPSLLYKM